MAGGGSVGTGSFVAPTSGAVLVPGANFTIICNTANIGAGSMNLNLVLGSNSSIIAKGVSTGAASSNTLWNIPLDLGALASPNASSQNANYTIRADGGAFETFVSKSFLIRRADGDSTSSSITSATSVTSSTLPPLFISPSSTSSVPSATPSTDSTPNPTSNSTSEPNPNKHKTQTNIAIAIITSILSLLFIILGIFLFKYRNHYGKVLALLPWQRFRGDENAVELETKGNLHEMEGAGKYELQAVSVGEVVRYELEGRGLGAMKMPPGVDGNAEGGGNEKEAGREGRERNCVSSDGSLVAERHARGDM